MTLADVLVICCLIFTGSCFEVTDKRALDSSSSVLTFKRRQYHGGDLKCRTQFCLNVPYGPRYVLCMLANCNRSVLPTRDLSEGAEPAVDRLPSSSTAAYCVRFLCGNQHLTTRMSCVQLACFRDPLADGYGAYQYGYPDDKNVEEDMEREGLLQEMSSVCRRLLCVNSNTAPWRMSDLLGADGDHVSVARRKTSDTAAQYKISNCGDFCNTEYSGVWLRRWCIVRCYKRLKL